ncbi:hypothetical protein HYN56_08740 [Flavobacterium crocinum]|uniref:Uncharacterized protein n=1 Tax=Flavobacterium crocinum TaxID=2183896 RepID=A0A2S1YKA2_9FLAO|nr:hypothetical protein [Flavobacterium crocinum]AWK04318.1 hypothetical protein HYN56_08740 [Flavobacterium crocinum]
MKNFILIFLPFFILKGFGQNSIEVPKPFKEIITPRAGSDEWYKLNNANNEFQVSITDGKLEVSKYNASKSCEIKTQDGKIIGIDVGEWGGILFFVPTESAKKSFVIKEGNIKFIFSYKDKIYFIEGLTHMIISEGALFELDISGPTISYKRILDFDDSPEALTIYQDQIFIAGYKNFYIINNLKKEVIFENTFWSSLYPNSIAVFNNENVFVGMRGGIVKLDLTKKSLNFYKND